MPPWFITPPFLFFIKIGKLESYHALRFEREQRYYEIRLQKDLLGDWTIVATNGRIKSKLGKNRTLAYKTYHEAFDNLCLIANIRQKRKYRLIIYTCCNAFYLYMLFALDCIETTAPKRRRDKMREREAIPTKIPSQSLNNLSETSPFHQQSFCF